MKSVFILALGAAIATGACATTASFATSTPLASENGPAAGTASQAAAGNTVAVQAPLYRDITIPAGTALPLSLTGSVASDTSVVEDAVTAELMRAITIDGFDVLPAGARLDGHVTGVGGPGRVKGQAMIAFRFTSLSTGSRQYDVQSSPSSHSGEMRLGPGADVSTQLTAPLTVRVRIS